MLRKLLLTLGLALLLTAATLTLFGNWPAALWCLINGAVLTVGIVFERWQYRRPQTQAPGAGWQATGERFVDPGSGELTELWFEPRTG
ncbi:MAG: hypothetical protein JWR16_1154, partial [Nevskia sp.]|nr:hypothetical protein [Nevskia sp.]